MKKYNQSPLPFQGQKRELMQEVLITIQVIRM